MAKQLNPKGERGTKKLNTWKFAYNFTYTINKWAKGKSIKDGGSS